MLHPHPPRHLSTDICLNIAGGLRDAPCVHTRHLSHLLRASCLLSVIAEHSQYRRQPLHQLPTASFLPATTPHTDLPRLDQLTLVDVLLATLLQSHSVGWKLSRVGCILSQPQSLLLRGQGPTNLSRCACQHWCKPFATSLWQQAVWSDRLLQWADAEALRQGGRMSSRRSGVRP